MIFRLAVEIVKTNEQLPIDLIIRSYRFSKFGLVAMLLHKIEPQTINKILDSVVPTLGLDIPGVRYFDLTSHESLPTALRSAGTIMAFSAYFKHILRSERLVSAASRPRVPGHLS